MLTDRDYADFVRDGYIIVRDALRDGEINAALKQINHSIGHCGIDADRMKVKSQHVFCRELTQQRELLQIANEGRIGDGARQLVGEQLLPADSVQIALRFPIAESSDSPMIPHIDGTYDPENGMRADQFFSFTLLAVALLADVPETDSGNFTVYPGSHSVLEQYFQRHGAEQVMHGIPSDCNVGRPRQLTARRGDVVLAHYMLAHTVAPHRSHNIRYAMIYRFKHAGHDSQKPLQAADIWREYEGIAS